MILFAYGTRPEALKLAKIVALCRAKFPVTVWCTNQSPDLLDDRVLKPDNVGPVSAIPFEVFDLVVVQGDTRSTFEAAVAAFNAGVPILHVEAGVRSGDLSSPFPEEGYRKMISQVTTYHACTTQHNWRNLIAERDDPDGYYDLPVPDCRPHFHSLWRGAYAEHRAVEYGEHYDNIRITGSPIVESVRERITRTGEIVSRTEFNLRYALITLHRRENRGHFADILNGANDELGSMCIAEWPTHPNGWAYDEAVDFGRTLAIPPMDAHTFAARLVQADVCVTDSGGVQEECNVLGVPCVVARTVTDRPESLGKGGAILGGNTREGIAQAIEEALNIDRSTILTSIYGDGTASQTIAEWIGEIVCK